MSANDKKYGSSARHTARIASKQALGEYGKEILGAGNLASSAETLFRQICALSDCVIDAIEDDDAGAGQINILIGETLTAGTILFGRFHDITITEGILVCYKEGHDANVFNPMLGRS